MLLLTARGSDKYLWCDANNDFKYFKNESSSCSDVTAVDGIYCACDVDKNVMYIVL